MIHVTSETKQLKKILLYRPSEELLNLIPSNMEELLFDDIPYLKNAQKEHDFFANVLKENGVEVAYLDELMKEVLNKHPEIRNSFLSQFIKEAGIENKRDASLLIDYLNENYKDNGQLIHKLIAGLRKKELSVTGEFSSYPEMLMDPIPNLYFQRDPAAVIGNGISINHMHTETRRRETIFYEYIFQYHKDFNEVPVYYHRDDAYEIEGGDVLNLSKKAIAIGISERTTLEAVKKLALNCFEDKNCEIESIYAFSIPKTRAYMHLDTVFTQVDTNRFIVHPHAIQELKVTRIVSDAKGGVKEETLNESIEEILAQILDVKEVELLYCGGGDEIASQREQWNDGSNTLCISPGVIITYDRNEITNNYLRNKGLTVIEMPSSELARGRGGPHCMSLPLYRED